VWLCVVENLVTALRPEIGRWLPLQAVNSLFIPGDPLAATPDGTVLPLEPALVLTAFLGYAAAATVAAVVLLRRGRVSVRRSRPGGRCRPADSRRRPSR
jgi:hypothetical protein